MIAVMEVQETSNVRGNVDMINYSDVHLYAATGEPGAKVKS